MQKIVHYLFSDMINMKTFDPDLFNIDKIPFKNIRAVIYDIEYIRVNIHNKDYLYLIFNNTDGYIRKTNEDKYLIFASTGKNKEVFKKIHKNLE